MAGQDKRSTPVQVCECREIKRGGGGGEIRDGERSKKTRGTRDEQSGGSVDEMGEARGEGQGGGSPGVRAGCAGSCWCICICSAAGCRTRSAYSRAMRGLPFGRRGTSDEPVELGQAALHWAMQGRKGMPDTEPCVPRPPGRWRASREATAVTSVRRFLPSCRRQRQPEQDRPGQQQEQEQGTEARVRWVQAP